MVKVSVITTFRNAGGFLEKSLQSVLAQSLTDFEHILINDGSSDAWQAVLERLRDPRQRVVSNVPAIGRVRALNQALDMARGEYVAILDADDFARPERLARQTALLDAKPEVVLAGTYCRFLDENGVFLDMFTPPTEAEELRQSMAWYNPFVHSSIMFRRSAVREYPEDYPYAHDFRVYLNLMEKGELLNLPVALVDVTLHSGQMRNAPSLAIARLQDELRCYELAGSRPGLTVETRKKAARAKMYVGLRLALTLLAANRGKEGGRVLISSFASSPRLFCRAFWVNQDLRSLLLGRE